MAEQDPLETLREQVRAATEAAERLVREVGVTAGPVDAGPAADPAQSEGRPDPSAAAGRPRAVRGAGGSWPPPPGRPPADQSSGASRPTGSQVPPAGWQSPRDGEAVGELQALAGLLQSLRDVLPADLQEQLTEVIRQVLLLLRALIDWAVARIERGEPGRDVAPEDIPIS